MVFPSAGAAAGKEHVRRKCSFCGVLLPSTQLEHVRGGQARGDPGREQEKTTNREDTFPMPVESV